MLKKEELDILTKKFETFLNENDCWYRANSVIHKKFKKEFNRSRRTLNRWRKNLLEGKRIVEDCWSGMYRNLIDLTNCYFCEKEHNLTVHHVDLNQDNNDKKNLLVMCYCCHNRLHNLLKRTGKRTEHRTSVEDIRILNDC